MNDTHKDIGLIGLAVMGQNLALNIADHGFKISVFNRTYSKTVDFLNRNSTIPNLFGYENLDAFVSSLKRPCKIIIMVQAGKPTDLVIESLIPILQKDDVIIDGGNAKWTDTIHRERKLADLGIHFVGSGVSGGEEGARYGPSLMPGGSREAWNQIKDIWISISAKVNAKTGSLLKVWGKKKFMGITKLDGYTRYRHIDIIDTEIDQYPFAQLYFTGSGGFNSHMRMLALKKGYSMNEYCISDKKTKKPVTKEEIISKLGKEKFETEEDIFKFIDLDYVVPENRNTTTLSKIL